MFCAINSEKNLLAHVIYNLFQGIVPIERFNDREQKDPYKKITFQRDSRGENLASILVVLQKDLRRFAWYIFTATQFSNFLQPENPIYVKESNSGSVKKLKVWYVLCTGRANQFQVIFGSCLWLLPHDFIRKLNSFTLHFPPISCNRQFKILLKYLYTCG